MTRLGLMTIALAGGLAVAVGLALALAGVTALLTAFVGVNVATMLVYGYDKYVSKSRGRRVPEAALHIMAMAGGTPGAYLAQLVFRHKTRDRRFRRMFWAIAVVQVFALLTWSHWHNG